MALGSGIRDPESGIRKKPIPDPGSMGQKGTGSRIRNTEKYEALQTLDQTRKLRQSFRKKPSQRRGFGYFFFTPTFSLKVCQLTRLFFA